MAALVLTPAPTFRAPAEITVPGEEAPTEITVEWRYKGRKNFLAWSADFLATLSRGEFDAAVDKLGAVMVAWEGPDVPYSAEALATMMDAYPASPMDLYRSYGAALFESRRKN
jgi:tail assembly chaperone